MSEQAKFDDAMRKLLQVKPGDLKPVKTEALKPSAPQDPKPR
jgi:hypothetical protein